MDIETAKFVAAMTTLKAIKNKVSEEKYAAVATEFHAMLTS
jgi:hypothetical protein